MTVALQKMRECLRIILKPVAQFCIRHSIGVQEILEDLKLVLLEAAQEKLRTSGEELNVSKLSAMTGVHRRDVRRICKHDETKSEPQSPVSKIIGRWQTDPRFMRRDGKPRVLRINDDENEFAKLVEQVCSDLHPTTVLSELERLAMVEHVPTGLRLLSKVYVSRGNMREGFTFMAEDVRDLMAAVDANLEQQLETPNLHIATIFDRIVNSALPQVRTWLVQEGAALHQRARAFLAQFDCDTNPDLSPKQGIFRVVLGSFSLTEEIRSKKHGRK